MERMYVSHICDNLCLLKSILKLVALHIILNIIYTDILGILLTSQRHFHYWPKLFRQSPEVLLASSSASGSSN